MKKPIRVECSCGSINFVVYKYEDDTLDYIECAECGENIDWNSTTKKNKQKNIIL